MSIGASIVLPSRLVALFAAGLALCACDSLSNPFGDDAPSLNDILSAGWLTSDEEHSSPKLTPPLYCYGTIGKEDCYDRPLPKEERRLVGYQGPPPPRDEL